MLPEERCLQMANDPAAIEKHLRSTYPLLLSDFRKRFSTKSKYHANTRMLISNDEKYALVWSIRRMPDKPIGYENQQTSVGHVRLVIIGSWEVNPNQ